MNNDNDILNQFLQEWPLQRVKLMSLDEYTNIDKTSFCHWVESKTNVLGSIWGGSSFKFGIFKRADTSKVETRSAYSSEGDYAWTGKYGETKEEAFSEIKSIIVEIIECAQNKAFEKIVGIDLGTAYKWKIAFMYSNFSLIPIYNKEMLQKAAVQLGLKKETNFYRLQQSLLERNNADLDVIEYSNQLLELIDDHGKHEVNELAGTYEKSADVKVRYWAGGYHWGSTDDKSTEFYEKGIWRMGYSPDDEKGKLFYKLIHQVSVGDYIVLKSYGGTDVLKLSGLGKVVNITDANKGILGVDWLNKKQFYKGNAPKGKGAGNWFGTLLPINRQSEIEKFFSGYTLTPTKKEVKQKYPLNQILFGPPGTGKTYQLTNNYIKYFIDETEGKSKELFTYELVNELSWWEVIALSLYQLKTAKVNEILKHPLMQEKLSQSNNKKPQNTIWYWLQNHTKDSCPNVNVAKKSDIQIFWKNEKSLWSIDKELTAEILPDLMEKLDAWLNFEPLNSTVKRFEMITFHQSYSYEEFIEGIRPDMEEEGEMKYKLEPGIFLRIAEKARKDKDKPYAIFIDEINRGNISKIFGELITLIEPDKRQGQENELEVTLPYSKTKFSVPANLHIIGTMNTADRSIALIDTALRRRFHFKEMMPEPTLLTTTIEEINLQSLLEKINERIEFLLDRDHTIGHSYFMRVESKKELCQVFLNKVIPLLQEYFYNDWEKIQLVLGDNKSWGKTEEQRLVKVKKHYTVNAEKDLFGFDVEDYEDEMIYEINPSLKNNEFDQIPIEAFKYIYEKPEKEKQA